MRTFEVTMQRGTGYETFKIQAKYYGLNGDGRTISFYRKESSDWGYNQADVVAIIGTALLVSIIVIGA